MKGRDPAPRPSEHAPSTTGPLRWGPPLALALFALVAAAFRVRSTDVFWHLVSGRWILEHREIACHDPFRFTSEGLRWVDHEWLFQVGLHLVERTGGVPALVVLRMALVSLLAAVLWQALREIGLAVPERAALITVALLGARPRFLVRPELPTLVLLSLLLILLRRYRGDGRRRWWILMALLTVLWVNLHGAAILAPAVAGVYLLGSRWGGNRVVGWGAVLGIPFLLFLALFLNPYGWRILLVAAGIGDAMRGLAAYNPEWVPAWVSPQPYLFLGVTAVGALALVAWIRERRPDPSSLLVTVLLTAIAFTAVRHQALFYVGSLPFVGEALVALGVGVEATRRWRRRAVFAVVISGLALVWCVIPPSSGPLRPRQGAFGLGFGIESDRFPDKAATMLEGRSDVGPLYNTFAHGGYLLWRLFPPRRVFHDGRMELRPGLLREIGEARRDNRSWNALLERYGAAGALVRYDERLRPVVEVDPGTGELRPAGMRTSNALLFPRRDYALVYWDDLVMLFLSRSLPQPEDLMAREYRYLQPEDLSWTLQRAAEDEDFLQGALAETEAKLADDPGCRRAEKIRELLIALEDD